MSMHDDETPNPITRPDVIIGCDLGQARDWTALAVLEQYRAPRTDAFTPSPARYDLVHLERMRETSYVDIVTHVTRLLRAIRDRYTIRRPEYVRRFRPDAEPNITLVVDATGVGMAVTDLFRRADLPGRMIAVTITGGDAVTRDGDTARVPKRDLASGIQVLLQSSRLRIAQGLSLAPVLQSELLNFRVRISLSGHDSYGAGSDWRDSAHDDLVLAVALACWQGEHGTRGDFAAITDPQTLDVLHNWGVI